MTAQPSPAPDPDQPAEAAVTEADTVTEVDTVTEADTDGTVETGDIVIDAALRDLAAVPDGDLDGHIEAAESLQRTLQGRLADLGE